MPTNFSDDSQIDKGQDYTLDHEDLPFLSIHFVQQVDELVSLAHYGPSIVLILGENGIGKTCTLEQLENETGEIGQIRIDGNPMLSIDQLHASFLQQLNNYEQAVEYNSVRDSLLRASEISEQLILVDDAQQLSTSVLESLVSLVSPIEQSPAVPVRLFLFGNQELRQQLKMDTFPQTAVYCMELKGFEKDEISPFLGQQLNLSDDDVEESFDQKSLTHLWKESHGNPGMIIGSLVNDDIELEDVEEITRNPMASIILRSLLGLLGVALLLLALFGEKWFGESWLQGNAKNEQRSGAVKSLDLDLKETKTETKQVKTEPQQELQISDTTDASRNDPSSQPPLAGNTDQIPTDQVQEQIQEAILNQDVVDNTHQYPAEKVPQQEISEKQPTAEEENTQLPTIPAESNSEIVLETQPKNATQAVEPSPQIIKTITSPRLNNYTENETYLLEQPSHHYAVQLVGLSNFQEIESFSKKLPANQQLYIYRSLLNGKPWFILVSGNYSNADSARAAKDNFAPQLKKLKPWIKSFAKIQSEIQRAAKSRK